MTQRALLIALPVVLLVTLAGCSSLAADPFDTDVDRDRYTVDAPLDPDEITDAHEPTDTDELLPGLPADETDEIDTGMLRQEHRNALGNQSRTYYFESETILENGTTLVNNSAELGHDPTTNAYHLTEQLTGSESTWRGFGDDFEPPLRVEKWDPGDADAFGRYEHANGSVQYEANDRGFVGYYSPTTNLLHRAEAYDIEVYDADQRYYRLHSTTPRENDRDLYVEDTFEAEVILDEDGVIVYAKIEGELDMAAVSDTGDVDNGTATYTEVATITGIGETTLEEPAWLEEAREATEKEDAETESKSEATEIVEIDDDVDLDVVESEE
ncbi:hypothetical protein OB919_06100 [Halobacteria archaeon AArc-curdl1]|uniref:Uncharacterized protein n=1 Tax=Natronosalvus hydrolyticus TaxID=2979988 RepID=A0AAP2Z6L8_9EURY|nr:hypothetical protein [Halobacteria archaeon AArc-curdl1]